MCPRRSFGQTVLIVEKILASRGTWTRARFCSSLGANRFQQLSTLLGTETFFLNRDEPYRSLTVPGQNDLVARFGASNQIGQLSLRIDYGNPHGSPLF